MPHLHHAAPSLRGASWTLAVAPPFPPSSAAVVADAAAAALVGPLFQTRTQRASPAGVEFHSVSAGPVGPLSLVPLRRGGHQASGRRRSLGRPSSSGLLCGSLLLPGGQ